MENSQMSTYEEQVYEAAHTWSKALCECAGCADYADTFWNRLVMVPGIYQEFVYYMLNQNFACKYLVQGISVVDLLVWQVDLFKAGMDMGRTEKNNPDRLLLSAFVAMLEIEEDPDRANRFRTDTGTDYPGKF